MSYEIGGPSFGISHNANTTENEIEEVLVSGDEDRDGGNATPHTDERGRKGGDEPNPDHMQTTGAATKNIATTKSKVRKQP